MSRTQDAYACQGYRKRKYFLWIQFTQTHTQYMDNNSPSRILKASSADDKIRYTFLSFHRTQVLLVHMKQSKARDQQVMSICCFFFSFFFWEEQEICWTLWMPNVTKIRHWQTSQTQIRRRKSRSTLFALTLETPVTTTADGIFFFFFFEKIRLDTSLESADRQTIQMKY